jgi:hypothetical protein
MQGKKMWLGGFRLLVAHYARRYFSRLALRCH